MTLKDKLPDRLKCSPLTTEYSASGSAYKTYADFAVFKDDTLHAQSSARSGSS